MQAPVRCENEAKRLEALLRYHLLDTPKEQSLDEFTEMAAEICEAPISLISLVADDRQWYKSQVGLSGSETPREVSLCAHAILGQDVFIVPDTAQDVRFADNPGVEGDPYIRYYAGTPLITWDGFALGTLCVIDRVPRELKPYQIRALKALGRQVMAHFELRRQTRELVESGELLRLVTENARVGLVIVDTRGEYLYANSTYSEIVGLPASDLIGRNVAAVHSDIYEDQIGPHLDRAFAGETITYEMRTKKSGHFVYQAVSCKPIKTGERVSFVVGVFTDITAHKRDELRIRHLNRVYAMLSDTNQTLVREKDSDAMLASACRIAVEKGHFSMAWISMLGLPGEKLRLAAHAGAAPDTIAVLESLLAADAFPCSFTLHALQKGQHGVCNDIFNDPRCQLWRQAALERGYQSMTSLPLTSDGKVIGTLNLYAEEEQFFDQAELRLLDELARDISFALEIHQRESEKALVAAALQESEERFRQLAENIQEVFWMSDPKNSLLLYVSPAYEKIWGCTPESLYAHPRSWLDSIYAEDRGRVSQAMQSQTQAGHYDETYRILRPDGSLRWIHDRAFPVYDAAGEVHRMVGTAEDITRQRELEEQFRQSQKMEAIGQLAGGVAHDFNNILAVIMMQADLASSDTQASHGTREVLDEIKAATERASNLTRQLLAFSRRQVLRTGPIDLNETVVTLTKMLNRIVGEDVQVDLHLHPQQLIIRADAGMLDQLLLNLVVNARDAMPSGGRLLIATAEKHFSEQEAAAIPDARCGRHVCLSVSDTGCGMSREIIERIFEPFFTTKAVGHGTGLGLATVFGIIKSHEGWVLVESEVGQGTTFQVFLPALAINTRMPVKACVKSKPRGGDETVLLVEDESSLRMLTRVVLERSGYRVLEASSGVEALRIWEAQGDSIALLFTDIVMPEGLGGRALAARLQASRPQLRVLFTSGYSADIAGHELSLQDGQNFIQKPATPQVILETVRRCLDTAPNYCQPPPSAL